MVLRSTGLQASISGAITLDSLGAPRVTEHLGRLHSASYLNALYGGFSGLDRNYGMAGLARAYESGFMAGPMSVGSPMVQRCPCRHLYGRPRIIDLADTTMNRLGAMRYEEFLKRHPAARADVEMRLGGRIHFGPTDGVIKVTPFAPGFARGLHAGADPSTLRVLEMFGDMERAVAGLGLGGHAHGGNPYDAFFAGGLARIASGILGGCYGSNYGSTYRGHGFNDRSSWIEEGPYQSEFGMGPMGDEASAILDDPSLEITDKICLFLMVVLKKIDNDIENQMEYINNLQQQANKKGGSGGGLGGMMGGMLGGMLGGAMGSQIGSSLMGGQSWGGKKDSSPSIDMESMKLKRMVDKRSNIFDALRSVIDRIQQLAKAVSDFSRG